MKKPIFFITFCFTFFLIYTALPAFSQVTVAVIPFTGEDSYKADVEAKFKELLPAGGGMALTADSMMKDIVALHEKAQALGSGYHDISKLKVAEYLIKGNVSAGKIAVQAIEVNEGIEVFNKTVKADRKNPYKLKRLIREMQDAILYHASKKKRDIPSEAKPYMEVVRNFTVSLESPESASYPYMALYHDGAYKKPVASDKDFAEKARLFLSVIRPNLVRAKITYCGMESKTPWVYIHVIADKRGKKTKHKFGIIELDNGNLCVGLYEEMR